MSVHPRLVRLDPQTRARLHAAAEAFEVPAELIAGVLIDEHARLDRWDAMQDVAVRFGLRLPGPVAAGWWRLLGGCCGRPVDSFSLGRAQMKPETLRHLGRLGYVDVPATPDALWRMLLDDRLAERLVAACLRATVDHWAAGGVAILHRPDVLGTLYSLGLTGANGVHAHPVANARGEGIARWASWLSTQGVLTGQAPQR
ncbi:hypothetical protein [Deinococcus sonorensis]|uniref:Winged helix DNA-binding domain-containing protein n=1 Tax=Deinococcus sonorensis KR-87 TaxID=694439 RepID=A0AAU7U6B3_9DEIO